MHQSPTNYIPKEKYQSISITCLCIHPRGGGGLTCHGFWYGRAAGVPGPHPIHILGEVKKQTYSYTFHSENCTHSYTNFQILPIHIPFLVNDILFM